MKIIITESQHNSVQAKLKDMVKKLGWVNTSKVVGGSENLAKVGFNSDPMEYLNTIEETFNLVKNDKGYVFFKNNTGDTLMVYLPSIQSLFINQHLVWQVLKIGFNLIYEEVQDIITNWFKDNYNLKVSVSRGNSAQTQFW